jgi:muconolactone delta-isomerase
MLSHAAEADMEFLVTMTTVVPDGVRDDEAADLRALPLADWLTVDTVPLTPHPSDPGA